MAIADHELCRKTAREIVDLLDADEITPHDLIDASLARIAEADAHTNAVPTLCEERARAHADRIMAGRKAKDAKQHPWLGGLPVLIKDLMEVEGVRTTFGSPIFSGNIPQKSAIEVQRIEDCGGIVLGKSNTPEFGAGANTFNEVFGATRNPWDTRLSCAGSSGGSAVALAAGMIWLADGSDLGGSLRTPASFCSIVGMRPSPGRVARGPGTTSFSTLSIEGPMARNVRDVALMLDVMSGFNSLDPLSYPAPAASYLDEAMKARLPDRIAFSADLGGITPVDAEVAAICGSALRLVSEQGCAVIENRCPDLSQSVAVFEALRAELFAAAHAPLLDAYRDQLKPEVIWNIERGLALTADEIGWAERERSLMQQRTAAFFANHDILATPAAIVPPFPVEQRFVAELGEHRFSSYIDWVTIAFGITLTGCPALSLPCGFTANGLPVGLQLVGPPRGEAQLLNAAAAIEDILGLANRVPLDPVVTHLRSSEAGGGV